MGSLLPPVLMLRGTFIGVAKCSLGHVGVVTGRSEVEYEDGSASVAYTGWHVWPLRLLFRRWSSRDPKWLYL